MVTKQTQSVRPSYKIGSFFPTITHWLHTFLSSVLVTSGHNLYLDEWFNKLNRVAGDQFVNLSKQNCSVPDKSLERVYTLEGTCCRNRFGLWLVYFLIWDKSRGLIPSIQTSLSSWEKYVAVVPARQDFLTKMGSSHAWGAPRVCRPQLHRHDVQTVLLVLKSDMLIANQIPELCYSFD